MAKAKNTPVAPADMVSLVAVEPIRIDGAAVDPGEAFEATPADARALLASGAAKAAKAAE
ncbi:MAG: hypothetical protein Q8O34_00675 [Rhodocyclaceae bacterium]|nr:hypothetical protein [Rhodocyclaceae bacterium]